MSPRITKVSENTTQAAGQAQRTVHEDRFGDVICVMSSDDVVNAKHRRPTIKGLASEDATKCAVILSAHLFHDSVHSPAVEFVI